MIIYYFLKHLGHEKDVRNPPERQSILNSIAVVEKMFDLQGLKGLKKNNDMDFVPPISSTLLHLNCNISSCFHATSVC